MFNGDSEFSYLAQPRQKIAAWHMESIVVFYCSEPGEEILRKYSKAFSTDYSKLDDDRAWSSQEWISEDTTHDRSGQFVKTSWSDTTSST